MYWLLKIQMLTPPLQKQFLLPQMIDKDAR